MSTLIQRQVNLPAHVIQFCRYLRQNGFELGALEQMDLLHAYQYHIPISFTENKALYRSIFVKNRKQNLLFGELYDTYWKELSRAEDSRSKEVEEENKSKSKKPQSQTAPTLQELKNWLYNGKIEEEKEVATYSAFEALTKKDFSSFSTDQHGDLREIIRILANRLANTYSRRYISSKKRKHIDLKNTIRLALRKGGEIQRVLFKQQHLRKTNLILICDVSKSMELYSQFLIEFMYNFQQTVFNVKTFIFSTRLVSLSKILKNSRYDKVLNQLSEQVPHWSGGTRIGECLAQFIEVYSRQLLNKDAIIILLSDGWDTGNIDVLESSMKQIHKKSQKIIWVNPLAGNPDYTPSTKAMEVSLPYIDVLTAAHNVDSLREMVKHLKV